MIYSLRLIGRKYLVKTFSAGELYAYIYSTQTVRVAMHSLKSCPEATEGYSTDAGNSTAATATRHIDFRILIIALMHTDSTPPTHLFVRDGLTVQIY